MNISRILEILVIFITAAMCGVIVIDHATGASAPLECIEGGQ